MTKSDNIGEKLKTIRVSRGLTQSELAEICGINQTQVTRYEKAVNKPTKRVLSKICKGLNIPPEYFSNTFEVSDSILDAEYTRLRDAILDPEDKLVLSRLLQSLYLTTQTKMDEPVKVNHVRRMKVSIAN